MKGLYLDLRSLLESRYLIQLWLRLRIKLRYSQTRLGILWLLLLPLLTTVIYSIAVGEILGARHLVDIPYVPFILSGQIVFTFFSTVLLKSRTAYLSVMSLANQVYFPREIILFLELGEAIFDFAMKLIIIFLVNLYFGLAFSWQIFFLPIPVILLILWTMVFAFFTSWWSIRFRDFQQLLTVCLQLLFFLTPILYDMKTVPNDYRFLFYFNPFSLIVTSFRSSVLGFGDFDCLAIFFSYLLAIFFLILGYRFFKSHEKDFMDYQ